MIDQTAPQIKAYACPECGRIITGLYTSTFGGKHRYECPSCGFVAGFPVKPKGPAS